MSESQRTLMVAASNAEPPKAAKVQVAGVGPRDTLIKELL